MIGRFAPVASIGLALWALVAALAWRGLSAEEREAERVKDELYRDVARRVERAARRDFDGFIEAEAHRPFYHYQFFYVPETVAGGAGVSRSPLGDLFQNGYARHYFQVDDQGRLTTPYWNRDLPGANDGLLERERRSRIESDLAARYGPLLRLLFLEEPRPDPATVGEAQTMRQQADNVLSNMDQTAQNRFFTNANESPPSDPNGNPSTVQEFAAFARSGCIVDPSGAIRIATSGPHAEPALPHAGPAPPPAAVDVRYTAFTSISARESRLLLRRVDAGGRRLLQGFEMDEALAAACVSASAEPLLLPGMALVACAATEDADPAGARAGFTIDLGGLRLRRALLDTSPGEVPDGLERRRALTLASVGALFLLLAAALAALFRFTAERVAFARERSLFATAVSHELRTPLAGLKLHAEMLEKGWTRGDPHAYAGRIRAEAERLSRLVENVLDASRLERGEAAAVAPRPCDPREVARRVHGLFAPLFEERGGLRLDVDEAGLWSEAALDPDAIAQVLANLLDNALRHGRGRVRMGLARAGGAIRFEVEDEGPGLSPEEAARAMERAFEPSPSRGAKGGLGLGLAMVRRIALAHGGRALCDGARFAVEVPGPSE